jgi:hypothetical protein
VLADTKIVKSFKKNQKKVLVDYEKNPNAHGELIEGGTFSGKV